MTDRLLKLLLSTILAFGVLAAGCGDDDDDTATDGGVVDTGMGDAS